jgi:hypothetical protein
MMGFCSFADDQVALSRDDVILLYSRHCSGSIEWANYLNKLYTELSKHKGKLRYTTILFQFAWSRLGKLPRVINEPFDLVALILNGFNLLEFLTIFCNQLHSYFIFEQRDHIFGLFCEVFLHYEDTKWCTGNKWVEIANRNVQKRMISFIE